MRVLKSLGTVLLWVAFAGVAAYAWHIANPVPCAAPIEYKIGTVDARFGVSEADFLKDIQKAGDLWSDAHGKPLFAYNPKGALTISLVYDTRQQTTQQETKLNAAIHQTTNMADSVKQQYSSLQDDYNQAQAEYKKQLAAYNAEQSSYNSSVEYWNDRGGAPPPEYRQLSEQRSDLQSKRQALEAKRAQVNNLAGKINALIDKYNLLVGHINDNVDAINNDGLAGTQFEEGVYTEDAKGKRIDIYQFDSQITFLRVIAHELGHSLGLGHNNGAGSIMNPVNQSKSFALSTEDVAALKAECKE